MPETTCQFREKPGLDPVCKVMPAEGKEMCPRHLLIDAQRQMVAHEKEKKKLLERKHHGPQPKTRRELIEQGYQFVGNDTCVCGKPIEYWRTPNQKVAPYDRMPNAESAANSHFQFCRDGLKNYYRRAS